MHLYEYTRHGTEKDFTTEPDCLLTIRVVIEQPDSRWMNESTLTYDNGGEPAPPPGRGWFRGLRHKGSTA